MLHFRRDVGYLALVALASRVVLLLCLPHGAVSEDLHHWTRVAEELRSGHNPYSTTNYLNWPPFWMQLLFVLDRIAAFTGAQLDTLIRLLLVMVDTFNIVLAYGVAAYLPRFESIRRIILAGLVLNPVSLLLVCQHGNFDVFIVTAMLVFAALILRYRERNEAADWLMACFALGIGVLIKTVPLLLVPLLCYRAAGIPSRLKIFGAFLLTTPVLIGMSVIYVLAPQAVMENVLRYRSHAGWFGISGLLEMARLESVSILYAGLFPILVIGLLILFAHRAMHAVDATGEQLVLMMGTLLTFAVATGPGFGMQYGAWLLPFLVLSYSGFDHRWRHDLKVAWLVMGLTYLIEYALTSEHGGFLLVLMPSPRLDRLSDWLGNPEVRTLLRLPLFVTLLWLSAGGLLRTRAQYQPEAIGSNVSSSC